MATYSTDEAKKRYKEVEEIIYLGDLLVPYGDFANRNHKLEKQGYIEQYWLAEVREKGGKSELFVDFEKTDRLNKNLDGVNSRLLELEKKNYELSFNFNELNKKEKELMPRGISRHQRG